MTGFPRHWTQRGALAYLLLPMTALYALAVWIRRLAYALGLLAQTRLRVPVIIVGNLLAGGTGKTPVVIGLVEALRAAGYKPGVISRGYGGSATGAMEVKGATDPAIAGDEPVLIAQRTGCPVWIGRHRAAAGAALLATNPECNVIVSDDGLQHFALARTAGIAVFDERGAGNGWPLPSGPLREPLSAANAVDFVLYQGLSAAPVAHGHAYAFHLDSREFLEVGNGGRTAAASAFGDKRVAAIAGIGNPQRFFRQLSDLGIHAHCVAFPDHHAFVAEDLDIAGADVVLMTEKDAVKCRAFARRECWALRVEAALPAAFCAAVLERVAKERPDGR